MTKAISHLFSVVSRCNTQKDSEDAVDCIKNIRQHHPNSDIVLVDSSSPSKVHFEEVRNYGCFIEDIQNNNYETGAMWSVYFAKKYNRDYYVFIQDSITVLGDLTPYFSRDVSIVDYCIGWQYCEQRHMDWAKQNLQYTDYTYIESEFPIVQYNSLIVSRSVLDKLHSKQLYNILPEKKYQSEAMERILGLCLYQEGYLQNPESLKISHNLINKTWKHRQ